MSGQSRITFWRRLDLQSAARTAYRELEKRDKRFLIASFDGAPEDLVMVFAKGQRAPEVRAALRPLLDKYGERTYVCPACGYDQFKMSNVRSSGVDVSIQPSCPVCMTERGENIPLRETSDPRGA